ncbi:hypothetical protein WJX73_008762 [Symbiochloris irregularis]|uniref:Uncharacterized protein n=1 Tax=Symbiochloris irregularis TaxID=706552 RepID=A0AAW1Q2Z4_9CHLO
MAANATTGLFGEYASDAEDLFGEYTSDAENSGSEGHGDNPDKGVALLRPAEIRVGPDPAVLLSVPSAAAEPAQFDTAVDIPLDTSTPPESKANRPVHNPELPAYLRNAPPGPVDAEVQGRVRDLLDVRHSTGATLAEMLTIHRGRTRMTGLRLSGLKPSVGAWQSASQLLLADI